MDFEQALKELNISLTPEQSAKFALYYQELVRVNEYMNLTAITECEEVYIKHFYDSLTLVQAYDFSKPVCLCDVGSGAGFPSLPLAIIFSDIKVTIIDALNKRIDFLNDLVKKLNLTNVKAIHARAEEYVIKNRASFDVVTARAVARLNVLSELCLPLVKPNGVFLAMKGIDTAEATEASNAISILGGKITASKAIRLPLNKGDRNIIIINKVKECPTKYPRAFAKIKDRPL